MLQLKTIYQTFNHDCKYSNQKTFINLNLNQNSEKKSEQNILKYA